VTLACILLVGAGLLIRSLLQVLNVDLGFQPTRAATIRVDPGPRYSTRALRNAYFEEVLRRVREVPGFEAAGLTDALPLGKNRTWFAPLKGEVYPPGKFPLAFVRIVSEGYVTAMGIPVRAGRDFTDADTDGKERVMLINESMARGLAPGRNPLGLQVGSGPSAPRIVGVVGDVRHLALESQAGWEMYFPMRQGDDYS